MLLVHGFPELWYSWRHQLEAFKDDYEVVSFDLRGYGLTDKPKVPVTDSTVHMSVLSVQSRVHLQQAAPSQAISIYVSGFLQADIVGQSLLPISLQQANCMSFLTLLECCHSCRLQ